MSARTRNSVWFLYVDPNKSFSVDSGPLSYFKNHFDGTPMSEAWVPPDITFSNSRLKPKDFVSWMPGSPVVSTEAMLVLAKLPDIEAEFLPLFERSGKKFFAINVIHETTRLNHQDSIIEYFDQAARQIMMVRSAVFDFERDRVPVAFKIRGYSGDIFVNHAFALAVRAAGLTGATFLDPRKDVLARVLRGDVTDDLIT